MVGIVCNSSLLFYLSLRVIDVGWEMVIIKIGWLQGGRYGRAPG